MQNLPIEMLYRNALTLIGEQHLENKLLTAELINSKKEITDLQGQLEKWQLEKNSEDSI